MCYITKVVPEVANVARELAVRMSHPGPEHWNSLGCLIRYIKEKIPKSSSSKILRLRKLLCFAVIIMLQTRRQ